MKNRLLFRLIIISMALFIFGIGSQSTSAHMRWEIYRIGQNAHDQVAAKTPLPTAPTISQGYPTPESRMLPPVGSNAGLVIGASVLVLIIIGGVLGARRKPKH